MDFGSPRLKKVRLLFSIMSPINISKRPTQIDPLNRGQFINIYTRQRGYSNTYFIDHLSYDIDVLVHECFVVNDTLSDHKYAQFILKVRDAIQKEIHETFSNHHYRKQPLFGTERVAKSLCHFFWRNSDRRIPHHLITCGAMTKIYQDRGHQTRRGNSPRQGSKN